MTGSAGSLVAISLVTAHVDWAWVVVFSNGLAGFWALGAHWYAPLRHRSLWWVVVAAEVAVFVQVGLGVALQSLQDRQGGDLHAFYGFLTIISVAILYAYRNQLRSRMYLLYGAGSLFIMGLAIRAIILDGR